MVWFSLALYTLTFSVLFVNWNYLVIDLTDNKLKKQKGYLLFCKSNFVGLFANVIKQNRLLPWKHSIISKALVKQWPSAQYFHYPHRK